MQYGFVIPLADVELIKSLTVELELYGWDGVFLGDSIAIDTPQTGPLPGYDVWVLLGALAVLTDRVRLGPLITAPSRRRPWKLAREVATLDQLSGGRAVLAVGLGAARDDAGFFAVGEAMGLRERAALLDETLQIVRELLSGKRVTHQGAHYSIEGMSLLPPPLQQPVPIWVVGAWPRPRSLRRVLNYDGIIPANMERRDYRMLAGDIQRLTDWLAQRGDKNDSFDIVIEGVTSVDDAEAAAAQVQPLIDAGATWWIESMWSWADDIDLLRRRIRQGPPRPT